MPSTVIICGETTEGPGIVLDQTPSETVRIHAVVLQDPTSGTTKIGLQKADTANPQSNLDSIAIQSSDGQVQRPEEHSVGRSSPITPNDPQGIELVRLANNLKAACNATNSAGTKFKILAPPSGP